MKMIKTMFVALLSVAAINAFADELDPVVSNLPQGLIVRENAEGTREVFKADVTVTSEVAADAAVQQFVNPENKIEKVAPKSELDQVSSDEAWCSYSSPYYGNSYYGSYYYSYSYWNTPSYSYTYYYYPSYSYNYGGYRYYYYYTDYSCHSRYYRR